MNSDSEYTIRISASLDHVPEAAWQEMAGRNPFVGYRFLRLLQSTGCASEKTGWHPRFLLLYRGDDLVAGAPCYLKTHSRGEFVFDQSWAQAFAQHGLEYYPKLVVAVPFTPVEGPRLLARDDEARAALAQAIGGLCGPAGASSAHVLFINKEDRSSLQGAGFMVREGVQFHWRNDGYASMEDFLSRLSHDKRKKLRQDSKYVARAGITYQRLEGRRLTDEHLNFFYLCYSNTYREHGSTPYLSAEFFSRAHDEGVLDLLLVLASRGDEPIACALNVKSNGVLYGRYWGTTEFHKGLHFETCYMQSIAYCIEHGILAFEGGAQGEHKMSRGLMPIKTYSAHWVEDPRFSRAIFDHLKSEALAIDGYVDELGKASPFKA